MKESRFNILAFTDADCVAPSIWLSSIAKEFLPEVGVVAGLLSDRTTVSTDVRRALV